MHQVESAGVAFFDERLHPITVVSGRRVGCSFSAVLLAEDRVLCLGSPIVPPPGLEEEPRWDERDWRSAHRREDCRLLLVDPDRPEEQTPVFCDDRLNAPIGQGLPNGHLLPSLDGSRVYAALEAIPELIVLDGEGEVVHRENYLEEDETAFQPTQAEIDAQYENAAAAMTLRRRYDWPVGLLRWGDGETRETEAVAIVFQRFDGERPVFVADLFDADGEKLADDLPLLHPDAPPLHDNAYVSTVPTPDGRSFLVIGDRKLSERKLIDQRLYEVVLELPDAGRSVEVSVFDDRGPVPGAQVIDVEVREAFLTDDRGIARMVERPRLPFEVSVRAEDRVTKSAWIAAGVERIDVELSRGSGFRVRLLDPEARSTIDAARFRPRQDGRFRTLDREAREDGTFVVAGLEPGPVEAKILVAGFRVARLEADLPPAGEIADLGDLVLDPGAVIEGVLAGDAGPLVDARVEAHRPSPSGRLGAEYHGDLLVDASDEGGHFRVAGLEPGDACVRIRHHGAPALALEVEALEDGETRDLGTIDAGGAGHRVIGRVVDAASEPLPGESIELRAGDADDPCWRLAATSDDRGRFAFDGVGVVDGEGEWIAVARRDGQVVARRPASIDAESDDEPVDLGDLVIAERIVRGRILRGGLVVHDGGVSLEPLLASDGDAPTPLFHAEDGRQRLVNDRPIALGAPIDSEGEFVVRGVLPAGPAVLTYREATGDAFRRLVEIPPLAESGAEIALDIDFTGRDLEGVALLADGSPAAGARLELHAEDLAVRETRADAAGRFLVPAAPDSGVLIARLGSRTAKSAVEPGARPRLALR